MKKWIDISPSEGIKRFIESDSIILLEFIENENHISINCGTYTFGINFSDAEKAYKKFNEIAGEIGLPHRMGENKSSAISVFRQHEEANRKKKRTVAEI